MGMPSYVIEKQIKVGVSYRPQSGDGGFNNNEFLNKAMEDEEDLLKKVLHSYLGVPATIEDFKQCERMQKEGEPNIYLFSHRKTILGKVEKTFDLLSYRVTFYPNTNQL